MATDVKWRKATEKTFIGTGLVRKDYGHGWGGLYVTTEAEPGDYYLTQDDLNKIPKEE